LHILRAYIANEAPKYNKGSGWTKENLKKILLKGKDSVTFDMVKGCIGEHSQKCSQIMSKYPVYLQSDISESKFQSKVSRLSKIKKPQAPQIKTLSGRMEKPKKFE
jgi:hypothetical protein